MRRREFIRKGVLAGVGGAFTAPSALGASLSLGSGGARVAPFGPARNVILFAYDGFGFEDLGSARYFAARHLDGRRLTLEGLFTRGAAGMSTTDSLSSIVTDSAAASTAWATGQKGVNGYLSMHADGTPLTTVLQLARDRGRATGVVTSTRLTHATPAAWIARIHHRDLEDEIALQYLAFAPDVMLGGGSRHFHPAFREDRRDLFSEFAREGYDVLRTGADLQNSRGSRLFGSFTEGHLPYEIDRQHGREVSPSLAELTRAGLRALSSHEDGFVLQVEAGRIDHANHENDPAALVWDIIAADDALDVLVDFVDRNPDTVLIVVSDHGTGLGGIFGHGASYGRSNAAFDTLASRTASQEHLLKRLGASPSAGEVRDAIGDFFQIGLSPGESEQVVEVLAGGMRVAHPAAHGASRSCNLHVLLSSGGTSRAERVNFNYATGNHSAGPVPLVVFGHGVDARPLGMVDNTELFHWMLAALEIDFRNPEPPSQTPAYNAGVAAPVLAGSLHR